MNRGFGPYSFMEYQMNDTDAWDRYPRHRKWFNKLYLAQLLGYNSGPSGTAPKQDGWYIVRPIYNLSGMSIGAEKKFINAGDLKQTPPGYFWCEWFDGEHYSVTYDFMHGEIATWNPISGWCGYKDGLKFTKWIRTDVYPNVPRALNELSDVGRINVEFIGNNVIEVHLRDTPDPDYDELIPIWQNDPQTLVDKYIRMGYSYINSYDDADGFLTPPRIGFMVKNNGNTY